MSNRKFIWAGHEFVERIQPEGHREVELHLAGEEFIADSRSLLREEAADLILKHETVQARLAK